MPQSLQKVLDVRPRQALERLEAQRRVLRHARGAERFGRGLDLCERDLLRRALDLGDCGSVSFLRSKVRCLHSRSTLCDVHEMPLSPADRIACTSRSLLALPVTKTAGQLRIPSEWRSRTY
jgi:hypothetical protein